MVYLAITPSHTKSNKVELIVSPKYLKPGDKVLYDDKARVMVNDLLVDYAYER